MANGMELIESIGRLLPQLMEGLKVTLSVFLGTLLMALPLGIGVALCRLSRYKVIQEVTKGYILLMRGTPLLLQIVFIYFGLPILGIKIPRMPSAILAFTLNYTAYFAEIFRAGIASIDKGQYEGAEVLGLSRVDTFFRIIMPQALKNVLPPLSNEIITLVKDTALVSAIAADDLLKIGQGAANRDASLMPLVVVAIVYLLLICVLSKGLAYVERKFDYYK